MPDNASVEADAFSRHLEERCQQLDRAGETTAGHVSGVDMLLVVVVFVALPILIAVLTAITA